MEVGVWEGEVSRMIPASPPALWELGRSAMLNQWLPESIGIDQDPEEHWAPPARKTGLGGRALLARQAATTSALSPC